jgi:arylsulfatase A-like enzyme
MSMKQTVIALLAALAGGFSPQDPAKPNFVFILADDLGVNDLSCYGRKDQPTPHLDRLAAEGLRFTSATCAQPICSPSRAAILTGKAPARLHLTTFLPGRADAPSQMLLHPKIRMQLPLEEVTLAERLKAAGYRTACVGKWHLGNKGFLPTDQGFDVYVPGQANTTPTPVEGGKGEYGLTAAAEKFLEENKDRPFFLYLPHNNPHIPLAARPDLVEKHKDAFHPLYAAVVETLDEAVGRLVAKLDALGLKERTLVIFTSDNGGLHVHEGRDLPATHNTPFRAGKGYAYEGGLRVPLLARWPGRIKPGVVDLPVINTDWTPTLLELAGLEAPEASDGVSLAPLLLKGEAPAPRPLFWHFPHYTNQGSRPWGAVREGPWKLVEHYEDGRLELFDLSADPGETTDLSAKEPARAAELRGKLEAWRRAVGAQGNTANPAFNAALWRKLYQDPDPSRFAPEGTAAGMMSRQAAWRKLMNDVRSGPGAAPAAAGAVLLHARDARVRGAKLRYEEAPHKDTLGFWTETEDWAEWEFEAPGTGPYDVEVLQGCERGSGGAEVEVSAAGQTLRFTVEETGHFQRFVPRALGALRLEKGARVTLAVRAKSKPGPAVMDLRRVTLRAAP